MNEEDAFRSAIARIDPLIPFDLVWSSTVGIVIERGPRFHMFGTGTLFRIADESFVITATHVLDDAEKEHCNLRIAGSQDRLIPLIGDSLRADRDPWDVAVIQLPPGAVAALNDKCFLRMDDVSLDEIGSDGLFAVFGFPEMMASDENGIFTMTRFFLMTHPLQENASGIDHDRRYHVLLQAQISDVKDYEGKPISFCYRGGVSAPFPDELKGVSGGSVWKIASTPADVRNPRRKRPQMVAVETGVYRKPACIKATKWRVVKNMIYEAYSDLRPALEMWRPND
jgi:hypothetical protein